MNNDTTGDDMELGIIFVHLIFRICERVIELIILILIIRYYGDDYYNLFILSKFYLLYINITLFHFIRKIRNYLIHNLNIFIVIIYYDVYMYI